MKLGISESDGEGSEWNYEHKLRKAGSVYNGEKTATRKKERKEKQYEKNVLSFYISTVQSFEVSTENVGVKWDNKYIYYTHAENTLLGYNI